MDNERKFDTCPCCKEKKLLDSVIGAYNGKLWAGWLCHDCLRDIQKKNQEKKNEHVSV